MINKHRTIINAVLLYVLVWLVVAAGELGLEARARRALPTRAEKNWCEAYQPIHLSLTENQREHPYQVSPPVGKYETIAVYQRGIQQDLDELAIGGQVASVTLAADKTAVFNLLGVNILATYDNYYLYALEGQPLPYLWDGKTLATSFHRIDFYMTRQ